MHNNRIARLKFLKIKAMTATKRIILHTTTKNPIKARANSKSSQMQPHFLYNVLASIQEIIFIDQEYAAKVVGDFTTYLRGAVRAMSNTQLISFEEELKNIRAYVEIEKVRFDDRLSVSYEIDVVDFDVPPLSIQPLVENAIRHGIYERGPAGGSVTIRCFEKDNSWIVQVQDTGMGFDVKDTLSTIQKGNAKPAGLKNLISRLYDTIHATVEFDSRRNVGTIVTVTIPRKKNNASRIVGG